MSPFSDDGSMYPKKQIDFKWTHVVGRTPLLGFIYDGGCAACKQEFSKDELVIAIGSPHFVAVHYKCWHEFDFGSRYKHPKPLSFYTGGGSFTS